MRSEIKSKERSSWCTFDGSWSVSTRYVVKAFVDGLLSLALTILDSLLLFIKLHIIYKKVAWKTNSDFIVLFLSGRSACEYGVNLNSSDFSGFAARPIGTEEVFLTTKLSIAECYIHIRGRTHGSREQATNFNFRVTRATFISQFTWSGPRCAEFHNCICALLDNFSLLYKHISTDKCRLALMLMPSIIWIRYNPIRPLLMQWRRLVVDCPNMLYQRWSST